FDFDPLLRAVASRGADHALAYFPQVDPVATQFECPRVDPRDREQIADHLIKVLRLFLDLPKEVFLCWRVELVAIVYEARGTTENGRKRRAKIVRHRRKQRI